ncbi:TPA: PAS domain-containing protein [Klebsiella quasipneumoniae subsp. quasipneumoniae]|uniref:helix-turn-helix transcriptional regulator n=1 Tax=Klebsiella quasipneumoniae TaxID=1463165 RepID=UPI00330824E9|nr:PAS domain-containing protein [Klebsiella quasipneumoniae subsp. quasipneumoniae]
MMTSKCMSKLTKSDELILASYSAMLDAFAVYFGSGYEFVLHRLDNLEKSVIKIINGHHTGRQEGAPITDLALNMLTKIEDESFPDDYICYQGVTKSGDPLRSSTIMIRGEARNPIGLICINFYLNTPMHKFMSEMFSLQQPAIASNGLNLTENFATDIEESIKDALVKARNHIENSPEVTSASQKNKAIIEYLHREGIFKLKGAVNSVSQALGIRKNTVYMHLQKME